MARVAVVGDISRDVVDGGSPTPGGCPEFAAAALRRLGHEGQIVTRFAPADARLFEDLGPGVTVLSAASTSGFALDYAGHEARIVVGGDFDRAAAERLGVPEVLLTLGSRGAVVFADGPETHVADDTFMVAHAVARIEGLDPVEAAGAATRLVGELLRERRQAR
jgi:sugar/nucleoside kinase (ribokinase family)